MFICAWLDGQRDLNFFHLVEIVDVPYDPDQQVYTRTWADRIVALEEKVKVLEEKCSRISS